MKHFDIEKNFRPKTLATIDKANQIISQYDMPLTVRQIYYRFVGEQLIENSLKSYKSLASTLARAREHGLIDYNSIVDRTRQAIKPSSWGSSKDFLNTVKTAYKHTLVSNQDNYIEVWVEKDALAGIFEPITAKYDVHLVVGRGYPSLSALYRASNRISRQSDKGAQVLYFGDFDPSGKDIFRDIQDRLMMHFGIKAQYELVALTQDDIEEHKLPPSPAKKTDSRAKDFISQYGDVSWELDALPPDVLTQKIISSIESKLDLSEYEEQLQVQAGEQSKIEKLISSIS